MKKLLLLLTLFVACPTFGQYGNTVTVHGTGAPPAGSGKCSVVRRYVDDANGNTYSCYGTTWVLSGTAGGGASGTPGIIPKFTGVTTLGDSTVQDTGDITPGNVLRSNGTNFISSPLSYTDISGSPTTPPGQNGIVSGCMVSWAGGLVFTVQSCTYVIAGVQYTSPQANVTLDAAETSGGVNQDRIDVIAVNSSSVATFVKGTPGTPPSKPLVDPATQMELTFAYLAVDATAPSNVATTSLYLEDTEWTSAKSPNTDPPWKLASTSNPYAGTKDIEATGVAAGNYVTLTKPTAGTENLSAYNTLSFFIRSKAAWPNQKSLVLTWLNGSTQIGNAVTLKSGSLNFNSSTTGAYQQIVIQTAAFNTYAALVTTLKVTVAGSGAAIGFYLDNIQLQSGVPVVTLPNNLMIFRGAYAATTSYQPNDVVTYGGFAWVALLPSTGVTPVAGTTWAATATVSATAQPFTIQVPNEAGTGTTVNRLACWTDTAIPTMTAKICPNTSNLTSRYSTIIGVVSAGAGTTGNATIVTRGPATVDWDTNTTVKFACVPSVITAGMCHAADLTNAALPPLVNIVGFAQSTNVGAGAYGITVESAGSPTPSDANSVPMAFAQGLSPHVLTGFGYQQGLTSTASLNWYGSGGVRVGNASGQSMFGIKYALNGNGIIDGTEVYSQNYGFTEFNYGSIHDILDYGNGTGTITVRAPNADRYKTTLTGDATLANALNHGAGQLMFWKVTNNGGFSLGYGTNYRDKPIVSGIAGASTIIPYLDVDGTTYMQVSPTMPIKAEYVARATAITTTTLAKIGVDGPARLSANIGCTGTSAGAVADLTLTYTDTSNTAQVFTASATCTTLGAASVAESIHQVRVKAGTLVTFAVAITNTPTFDLDVLLESM